MTRYRPRLLAGLLVLALAACQSLEERAEERYQSALALMEAGDPERALVELRNVFDLNGQHREARTLYADTLVELGRDREASGQYLRLIEQYPDDLHGLTAVARLAMDRNDWDSVRRYGGRARELAPEDEGVRALAALIDYADALEAEDADARRGAVARAETLLETRPGELALHRIVVDGAMRDEDAPRVVARLDAALDAVPDDRGMQDLRVRVLSGLGERDALEAALRDRAARFPDEDVVVGDLVRYLVVAERPDDARAVLEDYVDAAEGPELRAARQTMLVGFVLEREGVDAALTAVDRALARAATGADGGLSVLRAQLLYRKGERDAAIAALEARLDGAGTEIGDNEARVVLAGMLEATGNRIGAQRLVAEVLEADGSQVGALKMQAAWDVEADRPDSAVSRLRTALDAAPEDTEAMALLAQAHLRNGDRALARDMLALAVDVSNRAPAETLRYAEFLVAEDRLVPAEEALVAALRARRGDLALMRALADVYRRQEDWTRAADVEESLRRQATPEALRAADGLQAARLAAEGRVGEAGAFLEGLAADQEGDLALAVAVLRSRLAGDDPEAARAYADDLLAEAPDDPTRRLVHAGAMHALGDLAAAETGYRAILADHPEQEGVWMSLIRLLLAQDRAADAEAALASGLAALPDGPNLLWTRASLQERAGDLEGALATYEALYAIASDNVVVANNLASMLSTLRTDPESLERAWAVARRLRDTEVPAFQDTYGWLAHRRGEHDTAVAYLEPAAAALTGDPAVQYHLGMAYLAQGRTDQAEAQFRRALEIETPGAPPPQVARARDALAAIEAGDVPAPAE